ncbi:hypothetical protein HNP33_003062 [Comamonas odontotermitis]|uniref:Uncharacterized protein n=1 Tax=Comamonas odontotermitis TaxID=379895 RepID=A0ABR6RIP3_9BURK|nr:hypothetical protein [Comamonas odontotermitis]MBB6578957.1 hypothetical protein [Comamonas odontotermitis]
MATINAPSLDTVQYVGDRGLAAEHGFVILNAAPVGTKVRLLDFSAGTKIHDAKLVFGALGAGSKVSIGIEAYDGTSFAEDAVALLPATDTAAAGVARSAAAPLRKKVRYFVTATITGAAATGRLDLTVLQAPEGI